MVNKILRRGSVCIIALYKHHRRFRSKGRSWLVPQFATCIETRIREGGHFSHGSGAGRGGSGTVSLGMNERQREMPGETFHMRVH